MRIGILGALESGRKLARHLNAVGISANFISTSLRQNPISLFRVRNYDVIHGLYMRPFVFLSLIWSKLFGKITVCHWMGTDVMKAASSTKFRIMALVLDHFVDLNIVFSENLQNELKLVGIESVIWPIPIDSEYFAIRKLPPLPQRFSVLCKIANEWLYGSDITLKLAKDLPDVNFIIVPGKNDEPSWLISQMKEAPNLAYLGWRDDMLSVYRETSALLRLTKHDGMSYMVLESLALGRQVIWSHDYLPHCYHVRNYDEVKKAILEIKKRPKLNVEGAQYVRKNFDSKQTIKKLVRMYNSLVSKNVRNLA